jgi:hypothetical protein
VTRAGEAYPARRFCGRQGLGGKGRIFEKPGAKTIAVTVAIR